MMGGCGGGGCGGGGCDGGGGTPENPNGGQGGGGGGSPMEPGEDNAVVGYTVCTFIASCGMGRSPIVWRDMGRSSAVVFRSSCIDVWRHVVRKNGQQFTS